MGKTLVARLAAAAAGGFLALAAATPALADSHTTTVDIKSSQVPTNAGDFETQECEGPFEDLADDQDGWHFILTNYSGELADLAISIDFTDASGAGVHVDADPAEFIRPGASNTVHLYLAADAGLTLVAASATGPSDGFEGNSQFVLSHTCPGTPGNGNGGTPTPTPGGETPPPDEETPPPGGETPPPGEGGLPVTGVQVGGLAALGAGLLAAGVAMLAVRRRRGLSEPELADS